ncbi:MAG: DUF2299 family protein [Thermoplasmatota archaeon]
MTLLDRRAKDQPSVQERVRGWLREDQIKFESLPAQDAVEFGLLVEYPPPGPSAKIHVVRPKGRHLIAIGMGVQLSPPHQAALLALPGPAREKVVRLLRKTVYQMGLIGFGANMENGIPTRWTLDYLLFDDGLTQNAFHTGLRMLFTAHLSVIETLNLELGAPPDARAAAPTGLAGYM